MVYLPPHHFKLLLLLIISLCMVSPAYAAVNTSDTYTIHDQPYTLFQTFVVMLAMGIIFLVGSLILSKEQNNDAFAALAIVPLFISAWMANQLDFPTRVFVTDLSDSTFWTQHNIYPSAFLTIFCFVLGVVAIAQLYRLLTSGTVEQPMGSDNSDDK